MNQRILRTAMAVLALTLGAAAPGQQPPISPEEAFSGMIRESKALSQEISDTLGTYQNATNPIRIELGRRTERRWYHEALYDLVIREVSQGGQTLRVVDPTAWPKRLPELLEALENSWRRNAGATQLQDQFYSAHIAYIRTLAVTYAFVESAKRYYLYADAPYPLDERYRQDLMERLDRIHTRANRLMRWMHYFRVQPDFALCTESLYFQGQPLWEERYGRIYHYDPQRPMPRQAFSRRSDLGRYFEIFVPQGNSASAPGNSRDAYAPLTGQSGRTQLPGAPATDKPGDDRETLALRQEWERIQEQLKDPGNRNNQTLRRRLAELQRELEWRMAQPEPSTAPVDPSAPETRQEAPQAEPPEVQDNERTQKLVVRLQALLGRPEVQQNEDLRKALEGFLEELRPGRPPLKPLPPSEEEPGDVPERPQPPSPPQSSEEL